jgi:hypothetical protein
LETFAPDDSDVPNPGVLAKPDIASKELGRIGEAGRDMGSLADLAREAENS